MLVVALNFRGTPEMTLHKYWARVSAECCRRRIEHGTARYDFLRLLHIRDDGLERQLGAASPAGQGERSAHQLQEAAPRKRIQPLGSAFGELAVQHLLKFGRAGKFFETAPV